MFAPTQIAENFIGVGEAKTSIKPLKLLVLAFIAGMFIALAGVTSTIASVSVSAPSLAKLVSGAIFPAGLAMVVIAGSELFTGNCLIVISVLDKKVKLTKMLKNLVIVYFGNLLGALFVSAGVVYSHIPSLFDGAAAQVIVSTATAKANLSFPDALIRGIFCNILVCIGVWMAAASKNIGGKILAMFFPIFIFVVCGFEHCIANMYYIPAGIMTAAEYSITADTLNLYGFFITNLIPVTIGNIIGGCGIGAAYWIAYLQVKKG